MKAFARTVLVAAALGLAAAAALISLDAMNGRGSHLFIFADGDAPGSQSILELPWQNGRGELVRLMDYGCEEPTGSNVITTSNLRIAYWTSAAGGAVTRRLRRPARGESRKRLVDPFLTEYQLKL